MLVTRTVFFSFLPLPYILPQSSTINFANNFDSFFFLLPLPYIVPQSSIISNRKSVVMEIY